MITSCVCKHSHFESQWFAKWTEQIAGRYEVKFHRKAWEFAAIAEAVHERKCLEPGKKGLGFAVGTEPLVSLFASYGPSILATDIEAGDVAKTWAASGQYAGEKAGLVKEKLIGTREFEERVEFRAVNMLDVSGLPEKSFDFLWSSCAIEHLGSLVAGLDFVKASARLLRPGGVAVHTTEYNVSSDSDTLRDGGTVLYRRRDMRWLALEIGTGLRLEEFDFDSGDHRYDLEPDQGPPFYESGRQHIKLRLGGFVATSALLIVQAA